MSKRIKMWPFFSFYGGKWRSAPHYPKPRHGMIVEPFSGAAGYATRYYDRQIVLIEKDRIIAELWRYLIRSSGDTIARLPLLDDGESVDDLQVPSGAKSLIGFWLNKGTAGPCKTPSAWMRSGIRPKSFWGPEIRERIAEQVEYIKHWIVAEGEYHSAPDIQATWFIDPPYQNAGKLYRHSSKDIDFSHLGRWCRTRKGQVIVCEHSKAEWLPFRPHIKIKSTEGKRGKSISDEWIWTK